VGGRLVKVWAHSSCESFLGLHGPHQGDNAAAALAAAEAFFGAPLSDDVVTEAFAGAQLPGRFEVLGRSPLVVADGAHNPAGAAAARVALAEDFALNGAVIAVVGMMRERDPEVMLEALGAGGWKRAVFATAPSPRAIPAAELAAVAARLGIDCEAVSDVGDALRRARESATAEDLIFVSGSLYVVGAARDAVRQDPFAAMSPAELA